MGRQNILNVGYDVQYLKKPNKQKTPSDVNNAQ